MRRIHGGPSRVCGKPTDHLPEIDRTAREQIESPVSKMALLENITECLKAENQPEGFSV